MNKENIKTEVAKLVTSCNVYHSDTGEWGYDNEKAIVDITQFVVKNLTIPNVRVRSLDINKIDFSRGDVRIEFRKCGHSKNSIVISSDEGDGYSFLKTEEPFDSKDLANWIGQLEHVVDYLKNGFNAP